MKGRLSILLFIIFEYLVIMFRCGGALKELYFTPLLQHMVRGISMRELLGHKAIYQPGVARKVCVFLCVCVCVCVLCVCARVRACVWSVYVFECMWACGHVFSVCLGMCVVCACLLIYKG